MTRYFTGAMPHEKRLQYCLWRTLYCPSDLGVNLWSQFDSCCSAKSRPWILIDAQCISPVVPSPQFEKHESQKCQHLLSILTWPRASPLRSPPVTGLALFLVRSLQNRQEMCCWHTCTQTFAHSLFSELQSPSESLAPLCTHNNLLLALTLVHDSAIANARLSGLQKTQEMLCEQVQMNRPVVIQQSLRF